MNLGVIIISMTPWNFKGLKPWAWMKSLRESILSRDREMLREQRLSPGSVNTGRLEEQRRACEWGGQPVRRAWGPTSQETEMFQGGSQAMLATTIITMLIAITAFWIPEERAFVQAASWLARLTLTSGPWPRAPSRLRSCLVSRLFP